VATLTQLERAVKRAHAAQRMAEQAARHTNQSDPRGDSDTTS
jgi:hypothetical protein